MNEPSEPIKDFTCRHLPDYSAHKCCFGCHNSAAHSQTDGMKYVVIPVYVDLLGFAIMQEGTEKAKQNNTHLVTKQYSAFGRVFRSYLLCCRQIQTVPASITINEPVKESS